MSANYNRPKPADPVWYRLDCTIEIWCGCGRVVRENVEIFAAERRLHASTRFYEIIRRLKCRRCGNRPRFVDVKRK